MAPREPEERSTAEIVREYIDLHPSIKDCLRMGILNLSALARRIIAEEPEVTSEDAALIACRRYELDPQSRLVEEDILAVLRSSKLEIRTKVTTLTVRPSWHIFRKLEDAFNLLQGSNAALHVIRGSAGVTIITDGAYADDIVELVGEDQVLERRSDLVELVVTSPTAIEDTPGTLAYLSTTLASRGINLLEVISTYKDTIFVLEKDQMVPAFETLNTIVES